MANDVTLVNAEATEDRLSRDVRQVTPPWLLQVADEASDRVWDMPYVELERAVESVFENELGKARAAKRVRLAFWAEVERCGGDSEAFNVSAFLGPLCTPSRFKKLCRQYHSIVAWLMIQPTRYDVRLRELSHMGEARMMEILETSPIAANGKVDSRLAMVQVKLWEILQNRVYGAVVERVEQKTLTATTTPEALAAAAGPASLPEIERRLLAIKERVETLRSPAPIRTDTAKEIAPTPAPLPHAARLVREPE